MAKLTDQTSRVKSTRAALRAFILLAAVASAIGLATVGGAGVMEVSAHQAHTCTSSNHCTNNGVSFITSTGDQWTNYDFKSASNHNDNVDWAVTMVFYNDAEIDWVKDRLVQYNSDVFRGGGTMTIRLLEAGEYQNGSSVPNGGTYNWDTDSGVKDEPNCTGAWGNHIRLYADTSPSAYSHDMLYNDTYGFYVVATSHQDYNDSCSGHKHGNGETAETAFAQHSDDVPGWNIYSDSFYMANNEAYRTDSGTTNTHYWYNDAYATKVYVSDH